MSAQAEFDFEARREEVRVASAAMIERIKKLLRAGRNCLSSYEAGERAARRKLTATKRANFLEAFIWGVARTLRGTQAGAVLADAMNALVVAEHRARANYADTLGRIDVVPDLPAPPRHSAAIVAGFAAGLSTQINQPLAAPAGATLLLA